MIVLKIVVILWRLNFLNQRKCIDCGALLNEEDVMKIIMEDGNCEIFPLSTCPECFKKNLIKTENRQE